MTDSPLRVDPISPVIGAEISGIDLSAPLTPEVVETLHQALMTHLVLFFRDQALSFEQHKAFCTSIRRRRRTAITPRFWWCTATRR